jgi:phage-related protein
MLYILVEKKEMSEISNTEPTVTFKPSSSTNQIEIHSDKINQIPNNADTNATTIDMEKMEIRDSLGELKHSKRPLI